MRLMRLIMEAAGMRRPPNVPTEEPARHLAQLRAHWLSAMWGGEHDAAAVIWAEIDRLERGQAGEPRSETGGGA